MPMPVQYALHKTTDSREFEKMVKDCAEKFGGENFPVMVGTVRFNMASIFYPMMGKLLYSAKII